MGASCTESGQDAKRSPEPMTDLRCWEPAIRCKAAGPFVPQKTMGMFSAADHAIHAPRLIISNCRS